ncbi:tetratricopeptide repeat protein [Corallococcus sp. NCSPR001]|uniref:tetratricopeptide repeat protein n=1 Tax=Corallococcus sp. NCSPR001 TaxID=2813576 RepID=UPI001A8D6739|nr:tetratricopeptide repeat protein [Corallococcus sp. NCRR]MBN9683149.1 tetratricopeptide repeat protein [Corallococcus sp. NCSPR001]WAS85323.1 tetratricopeptide repeat protein [Corallococcus sp. NCRR]
MTPSVPSAPPFFHAAGPSRGVLQAVAVVLAALAVYAPSLTGGLVYDDYVLVEANPWIRSATTLGDVFTQQLFGFVPGASASAAFYRPLTHVLLLAVHGVAGTSPWAYHLVSLVLHTVASLLVWVLARRVLDGQRPGAGLVAGLLFAVHPVHVEAVAWVSAVMDVAATTAGLGMLACLALRPLRPGRAVAGAGLWLVALLFKEVSAVLPGMLLTWELMDRAPPSAERRREWAWRYGPLVLTGAVYLALRLHAVGFSTVNSGWASLPPGLALFNALPLLAEHARLLVLPSGLSVLHPFEPVTSLASGRAWVGLGVALGLVAGLVVLRRRAPGAWLGLAWLVLPLLPALHLRALGESAVSERYDYLPSVGFCLVVAAAWGAWNARARRETTSSWALLPTAVAGAVLLAATARAATQVGVWQDEVSLWANAVEVSPEAPTPHYQLGDALLREGRVDEALPALEHAVRLRPTHPSTVNALAQALIKSGQPARARELLEAALVGMPENFGLHYRLGEALHALRDDAAATRAFQEAVRLAPASAEARVALGESLLRTGNAQEALAPLEEARRLAPEAPAVLEVLARVHRALGHEAQAREHEAAAARAGGSAP